MTPRRATALLLLTALLAPAPASAATLRCGATPHPGLADAAADGTIAGRAVELCRALATALLGPDATAALHLYAAPSDLDALRDGTDQVAFLTPDEVREHHLAARLIPGPVIHHIALAALAQPGVTTLANRVVCFMNGSPAHQALEAWAYDTGTPLIRSGFQEDGELHDAFAARRCDAMAGEAAELAEDAPPGTTILPAFAERPVLAAVPLMDPAAAAKILWALDAVLRPPSTNPWHSAPP